MAIGKKGGSYATVGRFNNYMGDVATQLSNVAFRDRKFKQDNEDEEAKAKALAKSNEDKNKLEKEKLLNDQFKDYLTPYSGVSTVDGMATVATAQMAQAVADSYKDYESGNKTLIEHKLLENKVKSDFGLLKINNDRIKTEAEDYQNLLKEGKINPAFDAKYQQFNNDYQKGNFAYVFNPKGDSKMIRYEKNEFGFPQGKEEITWGDFTTNKERNVLNNDFNDDITKFKTANPPELTEVLGYDTKTGTKQLTQRGKDAIALRVQEHLHNPDDLSNAYLAVSGNAEKDISDPVKIKEAQDYLTKRYEKAYGVEKTIDEATSRASLNETKKQNKLKQAETEATIEQPSTIIKEGFKDGVKLQAGANSFPLTNTTIKLAGGTESTATNAYVNKGGKMYLRVEKHGTATSTTSTSEGEKDKNASSRTSTSTNEKLIEVQMLDFGKDSDQIGRYAKKLGYKGAKDLQDHLIEQSGGDEFITTPDERKSNSKTKPKKIQFDSYGNIIK